MIENDTVRLLREIDAGIKMGISAIDEVREYVKCEDFGKKLDESKNEHKSLEREAEKLLDEYNDDGKEPSMMAKSMSKIKTEFKLGLNTSDKTSAELLTDGCNMGVKSLGKYLNKYEAADEKSKNITKKLIELEERFAADIRMYL